MKNAIRTSHEIHSFMPPQIMGLHCSGQAFANEGEYPVDKDMLLTNKSSFALLCAVAFFGFCFGQALASVLRGS